MAIIVAFIFILKSQKSSACVYALGLTLKNIYSQSTYAAQTSSFWIISVDNRSTCNLLLGVFIVWIFEAALYLEHAWPFLAIPEHSTQRQRIFE
jgi:hypothetical protein